MKFKARHLAMLAVFGVGIIGGNYTYKLLSNEPAANAAANALVNKTVPNFSLPDIEGVSHNIHEWAGEVVILNFWATWCPPCQKETPMFVELQDTYGTQGLQFVGIAIDDLDKVREFTDTYGINYPTLIGEDDAIKVAKDYGNRFGALPYTVIIDRKGTIVSVKRGELSREFTETAIKQLL